MRICAVIGWVLTCWAGIAGGARAQDATSAGAAPAAETTYRELPVREVTIFKDGHAFLLHQGTMPVDGRGDVVLDHLPAPVLGTFWPYSSDARARLAAVRAGRQRIEVEHDSLDIPQLIEGNEGARVVITTTSDEKLHGLIAGLPEPAPTMPATGERSAPPSAAPAARRFVILRLDEGERILPIDQIRDLTFVTPMRSTYRRVEERKVLTLDLAWDESPAATAEVGLTYLQKGIRWIPGYRITIDGEGRALVELQATLVNDLVDLEDVTVHLVVGVPRFSFAGMIDPIALQDQVAQLSSAYRSKSLSARAFSNAIMTQTARMQQSRDGGGSGAVSGPELTESTRSEDLFVFTVEHVTLKRGERLVMPIMASGMDYQDVYKLDLPLAPPPDVYRHFNTKQRSELARLLARPKVMHMIRLDNQSGYPLTTAPALILRGGRLLAQGLMTYTPAGGASDVTVTAAVDLKVEKSEKELARIPDAVRYEGQRYTRVSLQGSIDLTNYRDKPIVVEVTRHVLGNVDEADPDGEISRLNVFEDDSFLDEDDTPDWWMWYGWPWWWYHFNGVGKIRWKVEIDAGEQITLGYTWHYLWN